MPDSSNNRTLIQIPVTQGAAGAIDVVAAPGVGLKIYVTNIVLSIATTGTLQFFEGTGPTALSGVMPFAAASIWDQTGSASEPVLSTNTPNAKLTFTSATGVLTGYIRYFIAP